MMSGSGRSKVKSFGGLSLEFGQCWKLSCSYY